MTKYINKNMIVIKQPYQDNSFRGNEADIASVTIIT